MIVRRYEVFFTDSMGDVVLHRRFRRQAARSKASDLNDWMEKPIVSVRDRRAPARRTKAFLDGH